MRRALPVLVGLVAAALFAELYLRWRHPEIGRRGFADPVLGWTSSEYDGFDPSAEPKGERLRLLVLGDSYLAGVNVRQMRERFPTFLEDELPDQLEVAILAASGWGPDQELLAFREKGAAWRPDVVLVAFCANNDLINVLSNTQGGRSRKPYFVLEEQGDGAGQLALYDSRGRPLAFRPRSGTRRRSQSYLLDLLRGRLASFERESDSRAGVDPRYTLFDGAGYDWRAREVAALGEELSWSPQSGVNDVNAYLHEDFPINGYQWRLVEAIFGELRDRARAVGARLVIGILPTPYAARDMRLVVGAGTEHRFGTPDGPVTFRTDEPRDRLAAIAARLGVELFDPTAAFVERVLEEGLVERCWPQPHNRHFGRVGHYLLAQELGAYLRELELLP